MTRIIVPLAVVAFVLAFIAWGDGGPALYTVGSAETHDAGAVVALVNSTETIDAGNYDTFESPRGEAFTVGTGETLVIAVIVASGTGDIGYGDDAVSNSTAAPSNTVTVCAFFDGGSAWCPVPAGKAPFVRVDQAGSVQATGVLR